MYEQTHRFGADLVPFFTLDAAVLVNTGAFQHDSAPGIVVVVAVQFV